MDYTQIIKLHRDDLEHYPEPDIYTLQEYFSLSADPDDLLWLIALRIRERYNKAQMPGNELFRTYQMPQGTVLYHGTHNRLIGDKPYSPGYFSPDPLQSIGHILRDFKELAVADAVGDSQLVDKKLADLRCLPLVYHYHLLGDLVLLELTQPHRSETFQNLIDVDLLIGVVNRTDNAEQIKQGFITKIRTLGSTVKETDTFETLLRNYQHNCMNTCFGGWTNTPGYYLLNSIDYNRYFQALGLIRPDQRVQGLYIPNDQDEVVLFDTDLLQNIAISVLLPYSYMGRADAVGFIKNFITAAREEKIALAKEYNQVNGQEWNFSWYMTDLPDYNPRLPSADAGWGFRFEINDYLQRIEHGKEICSSKLSIKDIDQLFVQLQMYIDTILNRWTVRELGINLEQVCSSVQLFERSVIYQ